MADETTNMQDAEAELAAAATRRPTRQNAGVAPIDGGSTDASETRVARNLSAQGTTALSTGIDRSREITQADIKLPNLKLGQPGTPEVQDEESDIRSGDWFYTLDNTNYGKKVRVVPLEVFKQRAYFIQGAGLSCRSFDMVTGIGDPGGDCEECTLKDWPPQGEKGGPKCNISYNFPVVIIVDEPTEDDLIMPQLALMRLVRTSADAAQKMIGMWQQYGRPWYECSFRMGSIRKTFGQSGHYNVATVNPGGPIPEAYQPILEKFAARISEVGARVVTDEDD